MGPRHGAVHGAGAAAQVGVRGGGGLVGAGRAGVGDVHRRESLLPLQPQGHFTPPPISPPPPFLSSPILMKADLANIGVMWRDQGVGDGVT